MTIITSKQTHYFLSVLGFSLSYLTSTSNAGFNGILGWVRFARKSESISLGAVKSFTVSHNI